MLGDRLYPRLDLIERGLVRDVKGYDYAVCPAVESLRNGAESLLSGRIPHLDSDFSVVRFHLVLAHSKLNSECG